MRPAALDPKHADPGAQGPRSCRKGGAQKPHGYLCQTSHWHLPDTGGIKVLAWPSRRPAHSWASPLRRSAHKTYYYQTATLLYLCQHSSERKKHSYSILHGWAPRTDLLDSCAVLPQPPRDAAPGMPTSTALRSRGSDAARRGPAGSNRPIGLWSRPAEVMSQTRKGPRPGTPG
jgi:hypothetical protein